MRLFWQFLIAVFIVEFAWIFFQLGEIHAALVIFRQIGIRP